MTRRVALGDIGGGVFGLKCSVPGVDVLTATGDGVSFTSQWGATCQIHQTGIIGYGETANFADLGYIPMVQLIRLKADGKAIGSLIIQEQWGQEGPLTTHTSFVCREPIVRIGRTTLTFYAKAQDFLPLRALPAAVNTSYVRYNIFRTLGHS